MPSYASNLDGMLQLTRDRVNSLTLLYQGQPVPVDVGSLPKKQQLADQAVQLVVFPDEKGEDSKPAGMKVAGKVWYHTTYLVVIAFVAPNLGDMKGNLQAYTAIRQSLRLAFRDTTPYANLPANVAGVKVKQAVFLDRRLLVQGYDYFATGVEVTVTE